MQTLNGIDISVWQGKVDFAKVKNAGIQFVILREGYRQATDGKFIEYVQGCRDNDIPIVGVYHFLYSISEDEARAEARSCLLSLAKVGLTSDQVIVFSDFEYDTVKKGKQRGVNLGKAQCIAHTVAFLDEISKAGYKTGIYTNIDYYRNMYDTDILSKHIVWLADYTGAPDYECTFQQTGSRGTVLGISGNVDTDVWFREEATSMGYSRQKVVDTALSWVGKKEADGSYKEIIDQYNQCPVGILPRKTKMQYGWAWCACTWSAIAIKLGYTAIMPIEISCYYLIEAAKKMGCWMENDGYVPSPGDGVLYDWDDSGVGDNTGNPDHVGTVVEVNKDSGYFIVVEGNYSNAVKKRTIAINGKYIRGFIVPKYTDNTVSNTPQVGGKSVDEVAHEVIAGTWGTGAYRKQKLQEAGYNYSEVQSRVNQILNGSAVQAKTQEQPQSQPTTKKVTATEYATGFNKSLAGTYKTTAALYMRNGAGTNKKALVCIPKGTEVQCFGYYSVANGAKWLYIQVAIDGVLYTGFSHSNYLKK